MNWWKRLAPVLVLQVFLWGTVAAFALGPWEWPMRSPSTLFGFVCASNVAILLGYLLVAHRAPVATGHENDFRRIFMWSIVATIVALPLTTYAKTGHWVPDVVGAVANPGQAYDQAFAYTQNQTNPASYVRIILAPLLASFIPLGVYYWSRWSPRYRFLVGCVAIAIVVLSVSTGQRRDIADLFVVGTLVALGSHFAGVTRWSKRAIGVGVACAALAFTAFGAYFIVSHVSRIGEQAADYGANPTTHVLPDPDNVILSHVPAELQPGFLGLMHYFTTGYYGLSLALDHEVIPMYGLGNSMFLTRNFERVTKDEGFEGESLAVRISEDDGFRYPVQWCTAYPYFANDLGFTGTIGLMFVLGSLFALSWIDLLGGRSPAALIAFSLLAILLFYLPATNRMLQDGEGVVAFYGCIAYWLISRWRRRATA
ncbi:MAG TPA: hypothetical protein VNI20_10150 [Fimbriimonadaceae bacterium]|nr:hypothetical protein [Fimbriimonadaceae bacterium]